jgi:hypothetical protein
MGLGKAEGRGVAGSAVPPSLRMTVKVTPQVRSRSAVAMEEGRRQNLGKGTMLADSVLKPTQ